MADILVTRTAREQMAKLSDIDAKAVDVGLHALDTETGEPINLPGAPAGTSYLAMPTSMYHPEKAGPVIIYRPRLPTEGGGWLVLSLLSPGDYKDVRRAEELAATTPAVRDLVQAIVSGTVSTSDVTANPGTPTVTQPGAASTNPASPSNP